MMVWRDELAAIARVWDDERRRDELPLATWDDVKVGTVLRGAGYVGKGYDTKHTDFKVRRHYDDGYTVEAGRLDETCTTTIRKRDVEGGLWVLVSLRLGRVDNSDLNALLEQASQCGKFVGVPEEMAPRCVLRPAHEGRCSTTGKTWCRSCGGSKTSGLGDCPVCLGTGTVVHCEAAGVGLHCILRKGHSSAHDLRATF